MDESDLTSVDDTREGHIASEVLGKPSHIMATFPKSTFMSHFPKVLQFDMQDVKVIAHRLICSFLRT